MTDLLGPSAGQHLLEVGCGMGHEIRRLAGRVAPGGSVLGIDMNHAMIDEARRRTADLGGTVRCQVGDVQRLELGDDAVDGVRTGPDVCPRSAAGDQRAGPGLSALAAGSSRSSWTTGRRWSTCRTGEPRNGCLTFSRIPSPTAGRAVPWPGRFTRPAAGHRRRTAPHRAAARDLPPARRAGPGRRGRDGDTRGSRLPALAGGGAGRRARRLSQRHVRRDGRLSPQA
jgi:SAM-dependent methyltransferase